MHRSTILAAFLLVAAAGAVAAQDDPAVETLFRQSCAPCHQVPDPRFETDRAWLEQIERTA